MRLSNLINEHFPESFLVKSLVPKALRGSWVEISIGLLAILWGMRKSQQNVRIHVSNGACPEMRKGLERIDTRGLNIPNALRGSWVQLALLIASSEFQDRLEPTRRECLTLRHSGGDQILLDWFLPSKSEGATPVVVYIPGITGRLREAIPFVKTALKRGWTAVVLHRRGHEEYLKRASFNIFGSARDVHVAVEAIRATCPAAPVALVGNSAGSAVMVRYLGQYGTEAHVVAGVGISPGYDIHGMWEEIRGSFFDRYLTDQLKQFFLERNKELLRKRNANAVTMLEGAKSVQEFAQHAAVFSSEHLDDEIESISQSYDDWLAQTCPLRVAESIRVPTLCINALDDPICHRGVVENVGIRLPDKNEYCALLTTRNGSHCAHQSWNGIRLVNWGHIAALDFLEGVISAKSTRT